MNKTLTVGIAALALLLTAGLAPRAQAVYFSVDVPVAAHFEVEDFSADLDSLSGYKLGLGNLIGWFGVGYESYKGDFKPSQFSEAVELDYTFTNLLLDLPIPLMNLTLGYGVGEIVAEDGKPSWDATQQFINLGIPIGAVFDVHLGYHVISGDSNNKPDTGDAKATTTTVGVRVGF